MGRRCQWIRQGVVALWVGAALTSHATGDNEPLVPAVEQLRRIQAQLKQDKARDDWRAFLADAERLRDFLHGSPAAEIEVARAQLQLGRHAAATQTLKRVVTMRATHPILDTPLFRPAMATIDAGSRLDRLSSPPAAVMSIADAALLPEDIDYDARRQTYFVTSVRRGAVFSLDAEGGVHPFVESPHHWPMVALKIDSTRRRLWATEVAFDGFASVPKADWGRSAVLEYDLDTASLLRRVEGPPHGALGDMVLLRNGDAIVSDGEGGGVYRVVGNALSRLDHGEFVSPQTPASCGDDQVLFIPDYVRGLATLDLRTGSVEWSPRGAFALDEMDGLYCSGNTLLAVQNGATHPRVVAYRLAGRRVTGMDVLDRGADGDFTHGVVVGPRFVFLATTGWRGMDDKGQPITGVTPVQPLVKAAAVLSRSRTCCLR